MYRTTQERVDILNNYFNAYGITFYKNKNSIECNGIRITEISNKLVYYVAHNNVPKHIEENIVDLFSNDCEKRAVTKKKVRSIACRNNAKLATIWSKGKTKYTDNRLNKISVDMMGEKNPVHKIKNRDDWKSNISSTMQNKIINGEFTPKTTNRKTTKNLEFNGRFYRSSWEVLWAYHNPHDEYEQTRIEYLYNGKRKITIVDFINKSKMRLVEIKPKSIVRRSKEQAKFSYIRKFCLENGYEFVVVDEDCISNLMEKIDFNNPPFNEDVMRLLRRYEDKIKKNS